MHYMFGPVYEEEEEEEEEELSLTGKDLPVGLDHATAEPPDEQPHSQTLRIVHNIYIYIYIYI